MLHTWLFDSCACLIVAHIENILLHTRRLLETAHSAFSDGSTFEHNEWVDVDGIAVSLSRNNIRRQDPNNYSDTEMRALSTLEPKNMSVENK